MNLSRVWTLLSVGMLAGCVAQSPVPLPPPPVASSVAVPPTDSNRANTFAETPYAVRAYAEPANPVIRHAAQTIYRRTRVSDRDPGKLRTVPRGAYASPSFSPLPVSEELTAELATQRKVTAELRSLQASLNEASQRMQEQYGALLQQSAETLKLQRQLEDERERSRATSPATTPVVAPVSPVSDTSEVKW